MVRPNVCLVRGSKYLLEAGADCRAIFSKFRSMNPWDFVIELGFVSFCRIFLYCKYKIVRGGDISTRVVLNLSSRTFIPFASSQTYTKVIDCHKNIY